MKKIFILILVQIISLQAWSQANNTYTIVVKDQNKIIDVVAKRVNAAIAILTPTIGLDAKQEELIKNIMLSSEKILFFETKNYNNKLPGIYFPMYAKVKEERLQIMKRVLTQIQYNKYMKLQHQIEETELLKMQEFIKLNPSLLKLVNKQLGWDILQSKIVYKTK